MDDIERLEAIAEHLDREDKRRGAQPGPMQADLRRIAAALARYATRWIVVGGHTYRVDDVESFTRTSDGVVLRMRSGREHPLELDDAQVDDLMKVVRL